MAEVTDSVVLEIVTKQNEANKRAFAETNKQFQDLGNSVSVFNKQFSLSPLANFGEKFASIVNTTIGAMTAKKSFDIISETADNIVNVYKRSQDFAGFTFKEFQALDNYFKKNNLNLIKNLRQTYRYLRTIKQYNVSEKEGLLQLSNILSRMDAKSRAAFATQYRLSKSFVELISNSARLNAQLKVEKSWFFQDEDLQAARAFKASIIDVKNELFGLSKPFVMGGMEILTNFFNDAADLFSRAANNLNKLNTEFPQLGNALSGIIDTLLRLGPILLAFRINPIAGVIATIADDLLSVNSSLKELWGLLEGKYKQFKEIFKSNSNTFGFFPNELSPEENKRRIELEKGLSKDFPIFKKIDPNTIEHIQTTRIINDKESNDNALNGNIFNNQNINIYVNGGEQSPLEVAQTVKDLLERESKSNFSNIGGVVVQ